MTATQSITTVDQEKDVLGNCPSSDRDERQQAYQLKKRELVADAGRLAHRMSACRSAG
jgi:hypothetical protein